MHRSLPTLIRRTLRLACGGAAALALLAPGKALAQHIVKPEVEKGQHELEAASHWFTGHNGGAAGDVREIQELGYQYGLTRFWLIKAILALERPIGGDHRADVAVLENVFEIQNAKTGGGIGYAWYTAGAAGLNSEATDGITFGPIFRIGAGATSLVLNPFFQQTFGRNREEGIDFVYGWHLAHELREGFAVAIEGFGGLPDFVGGGGPDEHRIGPSLAYDMPLPDKRTLGFDAAWLFGLNDVTPDHTIKFHIKYTY